MLLEGNPFLLLNLEPQEKMRAGYFPWFMNAILGSLSW
jgi:hypothetical protein